MARPSADCTTGVVAPSPSVARTAIAGAVDPAGNGDAVASAAAVAVGRTRSAGVGSSCAAAAVAEASDSVVDAIAAVSSGWA